MVRSPTSSQSLSRSRPTRRIAPVPKAPGSATLYCAEPLRAAACVVVDALIVRGWRVRLETGRNARAALRRSLDSGPTGLRVVCVSEALDPDVQRRTLRALDREGRGDLIIVPLETPRAVVEAVEKHAGTYVAPRRPPPSRATRAYLATPTLVESQLDVGQWWRFGIAGVATAAAVFTIIAAGISVEGGSRSAHALTTKPAPVRPLTAADAERSSLVDDVVYSARAPMHADDIVLLDSIDDLDVEEALSEPEPSIFELGRASATPPRTSKGVLPPAPLESPRTIDAQFPTIVDGDAGRRDVDVTPLGAFVPTDTLAPATVFPGGPLVPQPQIHRTHSTDSRVHPFAAKAMAQHSGPSGT